MAGSKTKTSVTLDRDLFARAEELSKRLRLSRSEFYARAVEEYVCSLEERALKDQINAALASLSADERAEGDETTAFLHHAAGMLPQHAESNE